MSEIFTVVCENIAVTAVQDVLSVLSSSTKKLQLLAVEIAAANQSLIQNYPMRIRYLPGMTLGSGGGSVTPRNVNPDGAAISATAHRNDTTQSTSSGTIADIVATMFNPINGYYWQPPVGNGDEPKADLSSGFALSLDGISGTINVSATLWLREI